jgi:hypothetical protein
MGIIESINERFWNDVKRRFWSKVAKGKDDECWLWQGGDNGLYGTVQIYGRPYYAHRVSYELCKGPIEENMVVMHTCDTYRCVNPNHLRVGKQLENMQDKMTKGRHRFVVRSMIGEKNPAASISVETAKEIREAYGDGMTYRKLARKYNLSSSQVFRIVKGESWKQLKQSTSTLTS